MATLLGDSNGNTLVGSKVSELINGLDGNDKLIGKGGDDTLVGGDGDDHMHSMGGNNHFDGGAGDDIMHTTYHLGEDVFQANRLNNGDDVIFRFRFGEDRIDLGDIDRADVVVTKLNPSKYLIEWGEPGNSIMLKAPIGSVAVDDFDTLFGPDPNGAGGEDEDDTQDGGGEDQDEDQTDGGAQGTGDDPVETGAADLTITQIQTSATDLAEDEDLNLVLSVANLGDADASAMTYFYYSADDVFGNGDEALITSDGHGTLDAGETDASEPVTLRHSTLSEFAEANGGTGYVFAVVDPLDEVAESNEANNVSDAIAFSVEQIMATDADLRFADAWLQDTQLSEGDSTRIWMHVENAGGSDAPGETAIFWSADDVFDDADILIDRDGHGTVAAGELDDNERESLDYDVLASLGDSGFIFAVIDYENLVAEADETNNVSDALFYEII